MSAQPEKPHGRADARRNAERVQEAALQMLETHGSDATVMDVATAAGVGKATVYRNFPTKASLLAFAAEHHGGWLVERLDAALAGGDELDGFASLVEDTMLRIRTAPILLEALRPHHGPEPAIGLAIGARLQSLIARSTAAGWMRADASVDDLGLLLIGSAEYLAERGADESGWRRGALLIVAALHAE